LVAIAFMFAIIIGYTVYMSKLTESMDMFEESKKIRLEQIQDEINKDDLNSP
jgi:hypothetical protein